MQVKTVSISDVHTHQVIYQRVYNWKATTNNNLGNLIESFYQFARTVDDGVVFGVDFESQPKDVVRRRRDDMLWDVRGDTMHMMTLRTTDFTVTAFFDLQGKVLASPEDERKFDIFLHSVKIAFDHLYLELLRQLRAKVLATQHPDMMPMMMDISCFYEFSAVVDILHEQAFVQQPHHFRQTRVAQTVAPQQGHRPPLSMPSILNDLGNNEKQLDHWLATQRAPPVVLSVEEEVRKCLEAVHITVAEVVLDPLPAAAHGVPN